MELKEYLEIHSPSVLNLGCGRICPPEHFGIDAEDFVGVDLKYDLSKGIPVDNDTFDQVLAKDFLEHIPQGKPCVSIMEEIYRVLKPGGSVFIEVPSTDAGGVGAFGHPYHLSFWNRDKIKYFLDDQYTNGWRQTIDVKCWFKPDFLVTYFNDYNMPYVKAKLDKKK